MQTKVISANASDFPNEVVQTLEQALPVALPTETVYGLAADALCPEAVVRIFEAKMRPSFDPLIVHIPKHSDWLAKITTIPKDAEELVARLTKSFWPGPLTFVLPKKAIVPDIVCSGLSTVAVRMPAHPVFQRVLQAFGKPLAAPSANRFGRISPTAASHVLEELSGRIPLIVDGGRTEHGIESTIIRIQSGAIEILRHGPVDAETLASFAPVVADQSVATQSSPSAPGQLLSHYAPKTSLMLLSSDEIAQPVAGKRCGLLTTTDEEHGFESVERLSADLRVAASELFAALRRLDSKGLDIIVAKRFSEEGLGRAINDKLIRAASR